MRMASSAAFAANLKKSLNGGAIKGQVCLSSDYFAASGVPIWHNALEMRPHGSATRVRRIEAIRDINPSVS
jgi:hypothetical protein